jgi:hypothetical protein
MMLARRRRVITRLAMALTVVVCSAGCSSVSSPAVTGGTSAVGGPVSGAPPVSSSSSSEAASALPVVEVDLAFHKKVLAMCDEMVAYNVAHQWGNAREYATPQVEQLPEVAAHLGAEPLNRDLPSTVAALGDPGAGASSWARLRGDVAAYATKASAQISAAKSGSVETYNAATVGVDRAFTTIREDLIAAGFHANDSCALLFAPPQAHHGEE